MLGLSSLRGGLRGGVMLGRDSIEIVWLEGKACFPVYSTDWHC